MGDFGGMAGVSQFAGGFMPTTQAAGGPSPGQQRSETSKQSLRPLTVKQLADANAASGGAELLLDGEPVENFTLVGKIRSTHPLPTYLEVKLDDGTGVADVRLWLDEDATASAAQVAELQPGRYVRVYGAFRSVADTPSIQGFKVRPVTDFNEVVYHPLDVIFAHQMLQKKAQGVPTSMTVGQGAPAGNFGAPAAAGWGAPAVHAVQTHGGSGMSPVAEACMRVFNEDVAARSDRGLHVHELMRKLSNRFSEGQVNEALDFLLQDAQIYSTIDDSHFKSTLF